MLSFARLVDDRRSYFIDSEVQAEVGSGVDVHTYLWQCVRGVCAAARARARKRPIEVEATKECRVNCEVTLGNHSCARSLIARYESKSQ